MAYFAPYIDASGLHIPTYQDIEDYLVDNARSVFGSDIYLEADSQDFQDIAARAQLIYDTLLTAQLAYNSRSPVTAIGAGLDAIVAINGIERAGDTNSTAPVTLTGTPFTVITNGVVGDDNGEQWDLPASVTIGAGGTVSTTATCQASGPVTALAGQINVIITPTAGWTAVTNPTAATPGRSEEQDSELRARQAVSVANPSQALTTGILGAVLDVENVASAQIYENDTNSALGEINGVPNPNDYPAHSITVVVDGGNDEDIASAIALRKTPGCFTDGDQSVVVYDRYSVPTTIRFYRPTDKAAFVELTIRALNGYSSTVGDAVKQALVDYLNSLVAGQSIIISELWQAALSVDTGSYPVFSLTSLEAAVGSGAPGTTDITLNFNEKATCEIDNITLLVT